MPLPPLNISTRVSLADGIYEALREAIRQGHLQAGEKLTEVSLAAHTNASRTPVREALRRLQSEGFLEPAGRSLVVSRLSLDDLSDLCVVREALEGLAARLAAGRRSDTDVLVLTDLNDTMRDAIERPAPDAVIHCNHAFHSTIWQIARNAQLTQRLKELRASIERLQVSTLHDRKRQLEALHEHQRIVQAIADGDPTAAEHETRQHFRRAEAIRLRLLRLREAQEHAG